MTKCCHDMLKQSSFWGPEVRFQASRKISFSANQRKPLLKNSTGLSWSVSYQSRPRSFWPKRSSRRWILLSLCIPLIHLSRHEMVNSEVSVTRREKKIRRRKRWTANLQIVESFKYLGVAETKKHSCFRPSLTGFEFRLHQYSLPFAAYFMNSIEIKTI